MTSKTRIYLLIAVLGTFLCACSGGGGGGSDDGGASGGSGGSGGNSFTQSDLGATSDATGVAEFSFSLPSGVASVQLIATAASGEIRLAELRGPSGDLIADSISEGSTGTSTGIGTSSFGFPTLDNVVTPGPYAVRYLTTTGGGKKVNPGISIRLSIITRHDSDLTSGVLPVNLVLVGPTANSEATLKAIQAAVQIWQEIYSQAGISLDVQVYSFDGPRDIPDPRVGSSFYTEISSATRPHALNVVIGVDIIGASGQQNENLGLSGGIPGPAVAGPRSVVALSITKTAGEDGRFNYDGPGATQLWDDEIAVGGEELANIAGQYLGLEPVVSFLGNKVVAADHLSDTRSCITETECRNEESPRDNVMFPRVYRKFGEGNKTYSRDKLTEQQRDILRRSVLVQ